MKCQTLWSSSPSSPSSSSSRAAPYWRLGAKSRPRCHEADTDGQATNEAQPQRSRQESCFTNRKLEEDSPGWSACSLFHMYDMFEREGLVSQTWVSTARGPGPYWGQELYRNCSSPLVLLMVVSPPRGRSSDEGRSLDHDETVSNDVSPKRAPKSKTQPRKMTSRFLQRKRASSLQPPILNPKP